MGKLYCSSALCPSCVFEAVTRNVTKRIKYAQFQTVLDSECVWCEEKYISISLI